MIARTPKGLLPAEGVIKRLREEKQWLQKQLADKTGLDLRTIQRAESGKVKIQRGALQSIATALGLDIADIVSSDPTTNLPRRSDQELVRLVATHSAEEVFTMLGAVSDIQYRLEGDPDRQQADKIARAIEIIGMLKEEATYLEGFEEHERMSLSDQIRKRGELNDLFTELRENNIRFFIGQYFFRENLVAMREYDSGQFQVITPKRIAKGVIAISTEKTRTINRQFFGLSEQEQIASLRQHLEAGATVDWPFWLHKLRLDYEPDEVDEVPF